MDVEELGAVMAKAKASAAEAAAAGGKTGIEANIQESKARRERLRKQRQEVWIKLIVCQGGVNTHVMVVSSFFRSANARRRAYHQRSEAAL